MGNSDIMISDSDIFICEAFRYILTAPPTELTEKIGSETPVSIANYLHNIPLAEQLDTAAMANHITAFCQKPGNETFNEWLGEIYDSLDEDGIDKLVKKTGDPDDIATAISKNYRQRVNESRDICQSLQIWANNVLNQNNQGSQNVTNSN